MKRSRSQAHLIDCVMRGEAVRHRRSGYLDDDAAPI
jgi:hypothetical protein